MKVTMLLADGAQAVGGKLYVLGGGWSICGPDPIPMALAIKIEVPWDQTNMKHTGKLELLDADGGEVMAPTPLGDRPIEVPLDFEVGRPPGLMPGTPIDLTLAINIPPLPIPPGARYVWRFSIDGKSTDDWRVAFTKLATLPEQPGLPSQ